jgi:hypothetical protein
MLQDDVRDLLNSSLALDLMSSNIPARMAYTGTDGAPRVVPVGFHWTGRRVVCTVPTAYQGPRPARRPTG